MVRQEVSSLASQYWEGEGEEQRLELGHFMVELGHFIVESRLDSAEFVVPGMFSNVFVFGLENAASWLCESLFINSTYFFCNHKFQIIKAFITLT